IGGTATNGADYAALPGTVTIPAGATAATIRVSPIDDAAVEGSETVLLTLSGSAAYGVGTPASAAVTIADNDGSPVASIWGSSATPGSVLPGAQPFELGLKFRSDVAGQVTGVRFYKPSGATGAHTGSLWDSAGNLLATVAFT